jgi:glycine/D-amino acid oxidase-like deaminating enzyme/nitrite reductase/ring-hydroxylating ferredoxin subunit
MTSMNPLWLDRPRTAHSPLVEHAAYDVAVVGGGITGLLTALLFARSGKTVGLLEARQLGDGTTGHTTAKVSVLQGTKLTRILRQNPPAVARAYVEANVEGQEWLRRFCGDHDVPFQERPAYTYATSDAGEEKARAELAAAEVAGLKAVWVDDPGLPFATRGAVRLDNQFQLHPMDLLEALTAQLLIEGGVVHESSRVRHARRTDAGVDLATENGTVTASTVVLATSMPILDRGGFFARLSPQRSYAAALRSDWVPEGMYLSADRVTRSLRSVPVQDEELLLVGGNGHTTGRGPSPKGQLDDLLDWAGKTFPGSEVTHTWSAQDHASVTQLPYVGPLTPTHDDILVATGFDKWGFTNAAAAALLLSKTVLGGLPSWGRAMSSWTPREIAGLPRALRFNGEVGLQMLNGYLRRPLGREVPAEGEGEVHYEGLRPVAESTVDGETHRVSAVCTHLRGVLRWNDAERSWDCPLHGSRFGPDGQVLEGPATCPLPRR